MKEAKNKGQNSQTEVHNLRLAFCWGPALLKWHPTEQARRSLAREIIARASEEGLHKDPFFLCHRGVTYTLAEDKPSGFVNENVDTVTDFIWCEVHESKDLFGD